MTVTLTAEGRARAETGKEMIRVGSKYKDRDPYFCLLDVLAACAAEGKDPNKILEEAKAGIAHTPFIEVIT